MCVFVCVCVCFGIYVFLFSLSFTGVLIIYLLALPSVYEHPQYVAILVTESLDVTCSFKAKPAANISWLYARTGIPDATILNITTIENNNKPYIITTSNMSWETTEEDKIKSIILVMLLII